MKKAIQGTAVVALLSAGSVSAEGITDLHQQYWTLR